jgi:hypothetical protein
MRDRTNMGRRVAFLVAFWVALIVAAGCASSQRAQLRTATDSYASIVSTLADFRTAGLIDDAQAAAIDVWRSAARTALDEWRIALEAGTSEECAVENYNRAMKALTDAILAAEGHNDG